MTELPLVALGGLLGSAHCVGMCGGFALRLGADAPSWRTNLARQAIYGGGRLFSYASLGAAAGYGGHKLVLAASVVNVQAYLAVAAGALLLWQGLKAVGLWPQRRSIRAGNFACLGPGLIGTLLQTRGFLAPLLAGVLTGLLPCGLVYAFLALAVAGGTLPMGMATMVCFGLGTLPMMTALGLGTALLGLAGRRRMLHFAAWCVVLTGTLSIVRGAAALTTARPAADAAPACPFCVEAATDAATPDLKMR